VDTKTNTTHIYSLGIGGDGYQVCLSPGIDGPLPETGHASRNGRDQGTEGIVEKEAVGHVRPTHVTGCQPARFV